MVEIFLFVGLGLVILYIGARLVFSAWFKTKEEFKKGGKKNGKE